MEYDFEMQNKCRLTIKDQRFKINDRNTGVTRVNREVTMQFTIYDVRFEMQITPLLKPSERSEESPMMVRLL